MSSSTLKSRGFSLNSKVISDYYQLTKPGITFTVVASMLIGYMFGAAGNIDLVLMLHAIIGTFLIAGGTAAHNQFMERNLDGLMKRTEKRPLPDRRIVPVHSRIFSLGLIFIGSAYLISIVNLTAGLVSLSTTIIYLAFYTPMKRVSAVNILIGAVPGALPPVGGWAAAGGSLLDPAIWLIFGIVFLWQIPHVMAIAWNCKDDYNNAGFKMLPKNDKSGIKTSAYALVCILLLFPITWFLYDLGLGREIFLYGSMALAIMFLVYGLRFAIERERVNARKLMFASIAYLPLVWVIMVLDQIIL